jgi:hypothetical protein
MHIKNKDGLEQPQVIIDKEKKKIEQTLGVKHLKKAM